MPDPMCPRIPSLGSALTYGVCDPKTARAVPRDDGEQFLDAMIRRGVTAINDEESKENS